MHAMQLRPRDGKQPTLQRLQGNEDPTVTAREGCWRRAKQHSNDPRNGGIILQHKTAMLNCLWVKSWQAHCLSGCSLS